MATTFCQNGWTDAGEYSQMCFSGQGTKWSVTQMSDDISDPFRERDMRDVDQIWIIITASLAFFMQLGFALLEIGSVTPTISHNIAMKNLFDACISCCTFYFIGWGIAYGEDVGGFFGSSDFMVNESGVYAEFMFQATFAGAATTIVSGSMAGRVKLEAYFAYTMVVCSITYPLVVHWVWGAGGFLNGWEDNSLGIIDFAGCSCVHMVGGFTGLVGTMMMGPRLEFTEALNRGETPPYHSIPFVVCGTLILWYGWYGFNCGSTLWASGGAMDVAGLVAINTTMAAACGAIACVVIGYYKEGYFHVATGCNGIIAGLVGITAPCPVVTPLASCMIGLSAGVIYYVLAELCMKWRIDDPVCAAPIHGGVGAWGLICCALFARDQDLAFAGYSQAVIDAGVGGRLFRQLCGIGIVGVFVVITAYGMFWMIDKFIGLRVDPDKERQGLDIAEHGGNPAYHFDNIDFDELLTAIKETTSVTLPPRLQQKIDRDSRGGYGN